MIFSEFFIWTLLNSVWWLFNSPFILNFWKLFGFMDVWVFFGCTFTLNFRLQVHQLIRLIGINDYFYWFFNLSFINRCLKNAIKCFYLEHSSILEVSGLLNIFRLHLQLVVQNRTCGSKFTFSPIIVYNNEFSLVFLFELYLMTSKNCPKFAITQIWK